MAMDETGEMDVQVPMVDLEPTVVRAHEEFQGSPALEVHQARQVPKDLLDLQAVAEDVTLMGEKL
ncbi:hypothetical protein KJ359_010380 [Pestalotiopsis sp. 9143b]|nr:hypothetical protein KJ359_010380 [Pestalotiopsis sp. 9143b]